MIFGSRWELIGRSSSTCPPRQQLPDQWIPLPRGVRSPSNDGQKEADSPALKNATLGIGWKMCGWKGSDFEQSGFNLDGRAMWLLTKICLLWLCCLHGSLCFWDCLGRLYNLVCLSLLDWLNNLFKFGCKKVGRRMDFFIHILCKISIKLWGEKRSSCPSKILWESGFWTPVPAWNKRMINLFWKYKFETVILETNVSQSFSLWLCPQEQMIF